MEKYLKLIEDDIFLVGSIFEEDDIENIKNEGIEFIKSISKKQLPEDISIKFTRSFISSSFRQHAIERMGFSLLTKKFIKGLANHIGNNKCLEIMAGQGCLSKSLQDEGIDIIATDNYSWENRLNMNDTWTTVEKIDCLDAIKKYGKDVSYIICSWIPYNNPIGYYALKLMNEVNPDCKMIVIGEGYGGCTADDLFFENSIEIPLNDDFIKDFRTWNCIHDYISVVKYKENCEEN